MVVVGLDGWAAVACCHPVMLAMTLQLIWIWCLHGQHQVLHELGCLSASWTVSVSLGRAKGQAWIRAFALHVYMITNTNLSKMVLSLSQCRKGGAKWKVNLHTHQGPSSGEAGKPSPSVTTMAPKRTRVGGSVSSFGHASSESPEAEQKKEIYILDAPLHIGPLCLSAGSGSCPSLGKSAPTRCIHHSSPHTTLHPICFLSVVLISTQLPPPLPSVYRSAEEIFMYKNKVAWYDGEDDEDEEGEGNNDDDDMVEEEEDKDGGGQGNNNDNKYVHSTSKEDDNDHELDEDKEEEVVEEEAEEDARHRGQRQ